MPHRSGTVASRRAFLGAVARTGGATLLGGAILGWYATGVEPGLIEVVRLRVSVSRLPGAFAGLSIAQISDLHLGPYVGAARVRVAVDLVLGLKPDIAVVTGDHVSRLDHGEAEVLSAEFSRLIAPLGVFAILGNHDHWTNARVVADALRNAGLTLLRNASVPIRRSGEAVFVAGVDDVWEGHHDLALALRGVPADGRAILLAHEPDFADEASRDARVSLQLSGHSHGGQVRIPGRGALLLPPFGLKYPYGLRRVGETWLYTNRGIGVVSPPMRLNCPPEVTLVELTEGQADTTRRTESHEDG